MTTWCRVSQATGVMTVDALRFYRIVVLLQTGCVWPPGNRVQQQAGEVEYLVGGQLYRGEKCPWGWAGLDRVQDGRLGCADLSFTRTRLSVLRTWQC